MSAFDRVGRKAQTILGKGTLTQERSTGKWIFIRSSDGKRFRLGFTLKESARALDELGKQRQEDNK